MSNPTPPSRHRKDPTEYESMEPQSAILLGECCDYIMGHSQNGRSAQCGPDRLAEQYQTEILYGPSRDGLDSAWPLRTLKLLIQRESEHNTKVPSDTYAIALRWIIHRAGIADPASRMAYILTIPKIPVQAAAKLLVIYDRSLTLQLPGQTMSCYPSIMAPPAAELLDPGFRLSDSATEYDAGQLLNELSLVMDAVEHNMQVQHSSNR